MKVFRSSFARFSAALAMAATASLASVTVASADPSDPVCIMPPEDYCTYLGGYTYGTTAWKQCYRTASALYYGEYCGGIWS